MTQPQATAEVFWTAFRAMKSSEREAFVEKLINDKTFGEDLRYAAIIKNRRGETTISLDDYIASRVKKK